MKMKKMAFLSMMAIMTASSINLTTTKADITITATIGLSNETHAQQIKNAKEQIRLAKQRLLNAKSKKQTSQTKIAT